METLNLDHIRMPAIKYWRYHLKYSGEIKVDSIEKKIDQLDIAEFLRFF